MMKLIFFLIINFFFVHQSAFSQEIKSSPLIGWDAFKNATLKSNPQIDSILHKTGLILISYQIVLTKKGNVKSISKIDDAPLNTSISDNILSALAGLKWLCGKNYKGKRIKGTQTFTLYWYDSTCTPLSIDTLDADTIFDSRTNTYRIKGEQACRFPGKDQKFIDFFKEEFAYPQRCEMERFSGYCLLQIEVNRFGQISDCIILENSPYCPEFGIDSKRVILLSTPWIPAVYKGKYVTSTRKMPINIHVENK
jgi:hypothetical protein